VEKSPKQPGDLTSLVRAAIASAGYFDMEITPQDHCARMAQPLLAARPDGSTRAASPVDCHPTDRQLKKIS
jgi:hypothetical protein